MRKYLRQFLPHHESVKNNRWLKPFGSRMQHPNLWHLNRRSVAGGVAVGLFCGLVPGPFQVISSAPLAVLFRVNLPVAIFVTFYTNPFTIVPLYMLAYELGAWISGAQNGRVVAQLDFPALHWNSWISELTSWLVKMGEPLLIGLPLLAVILAIAGYVAVRVIWRVVVILQMYSRKRRRDEP